MLIAVLHCSSDLLPLFVCHCLSSLFYNSTAVFWKDIDTMLLTFKILTFG